MSGSPENGQGDGVRAGSRASHGTGDAVSAVPASIPDAAEFCRAALIPEIERMLSELGNPPLVDRIFPNGWRNGDRGDLMHLYDLCRRTFIQREKVNG